MDVVVLEALAHGDALSVPQADNEDDAHPVPDTEALADDDGHVEPVADRQSDEDPVPERLGEALLHSVTETEGQVLAVIELLWEDETV